MNAENSDPSIRAGFFTTIAQAEEAVRALLAAGFSREQLAVIVPEQFHEDLAVDVPHAEGPGATAVEGLAAGSILGATLGGIALMAVTLATGGAALLPAATVLVGGGALAGGFGGLIVADGYGKGVGEYFDQAQQLGKIVVGVQVEGEHNAWQLDKAARILAEAGADFLTPAA